ncbi:GtrA family protein [Brevibacterium samyangense]|uniref:GtrA/DPMS transmembrane domain-containing protein n=1 Tax=Brevibacterium samyangense TaxID=366888 RepID=A0ABN2T785_9MICO
MTGHVSDPAAGTAPAPAPAVPRWRRLATEVFRFLMVGGLGYIVDVGVSNLLVYGIPFLGVPALLADSPLKAKIISTVASIFVAWIGNKFWTYGDRTGGGGVRGFLLFWVVNGIGMVIAVLPLGVSWYLLGLRDPISYNISTNVIGIGLAMIFRFYAYRTWVFREVSVPEVEVVDSAGTGSRSAVEEEQRS